MEIRQLKYFLVLADELHFRKAAEKLFIVQPALSKQIKNLEEELGITLFERNRRRVQLTAAGAYFRQEVADLLNRLEVVANRARLVSEGSGGEIRMGYVGSCIHTFLPDVIAALHDQFSHIHLYMDEMTTYAQLQALQRGALDIAFCRNPELGARFGRQLVFRETFSLVLPEKHAVTTDSFSGMEQLADEAFILPKRADGSQYYHLQLSICENAGFNPRIAHETVHGHTALKMVDQAFGISILPTSFQTVTTARLRFIELQDIWQRSEITAVWDRENPNPSLARLLQLLPNVEERLRD